uniref:SRR1-like domain-containing protein n=1 Tax=Oryza punctata TaxID=4537 RepID=A0A0E0KUH4_ORYPU
MATASASPPPPPPDLGSVTEEMAETEEPDQDRQEFVMGDHARLLSFLRLAMELAVASPLFAKLSALFSTDAACLDGLARVRGRGRERLRVVAYRLGGMQYSWAPRFRLAVLLLLRDRFPELVGAVEVVDPTVAPVERRAMEELGCIVTTSPALCLVVEKPTLIFMPYADRVFFENLLILNWTPDQLGKIVVLGHSFSAMVKMLELRISKQEKCGLTEQREKIIVLQGSGVMWHLDPSDAYIEDKHLREAKSIVKKMHETISDVRSSALYTKFADHVKKNESISSHISSMLGAHECIQLVIYGLGSFEFDVKSQYQLAFALLLKADNIFPIGDIEIYDPALSSADVKACFDLGLRVLLVNEQCQRSVDKPTLFFVPGLKFVGNLIESNFTAKQLNKIILVSYGFKNSGKSISAALENRSSGFTSIKVIVLENFNEEFWGVSELRVEFLDIAADVDMNSNVPSMCVFF